MESRVTWQKVSQKESIHRKQRVWTEGNKKDGAAKKVQSIGTENTDPRELLLSDSSEEEDSTLKQVRVIKAVTLNV